METDFYRCVFEGLLSSLPNHFTDNYDPRRFGKPSIGQRAKESLKGMLCRHGFYRFNPETLGRLSGHGAIENFRYLYELLDDPESKKLLVRIVLYRLLGHNKVRLPLNGRPILRLMDESVI